MAEVTAALVAKLRKATGAGMMDCKKALEATEGDLEKAADWLREHNFIKGAKFSDREATEGAVEALVDGNVGVLAELRCNTDFVAKGSDFTALVTAIANAVASATSIVLMLRVPCLPATARFWDRGHGTGGRLPHSRACRRPTDRPPARCHRPASPPDAPGESPTSWYSSECAPVRSDPPSGSCCARWPRWNTSKDKTRKGIFYAR